MLTPLAEPHPRCVLVRLPNPLGDVVMATPLLALLRAAWPHARLAAAGAADFAPLLAGLPDLDSFLPLPAAARSGAGAVGRQAAILRAADADLILLLPNSWSSALAALRAGIPRRIGRGGGGRGLILTQRLPRIPGPAPMTELYADFLAPLGLNRPPHLPPARLVLSAPVPPPLDNPAHGPWLGVAPGAAFGPSKVYPQDRLIEAVVQAARANGLTPVWLGAPSEAASLRATAELAATQLNQPAVVICGDLGAAKSALAACRALLAMDNGARHMAAALGIPQAVIYGPTHPAWSAHALELTVILRREGLPCLACHKSHCPFPDHPCMNQLAPQEVAAAVSRALDREGGPASLKVAGGPCRI
jgi:heptosyltransferase-2